jgi:beta-lactamase class D
MYRIGIATVLALASYAFTPRGVADAAAPRASTHSCVVIADSVSSNVWRSNPEACATRLSPASTFKVPHALVGLETGVVTPATSEAWDGTPYPNQPEWQHAHTVLSALKPSVLWFFQRMAPKIGAERMHEWLTRLKYGNADTSGDVKFYWVNGTLRVSPDEQVAFLRQLFAGTVPFRGESQQLVREALVQRTGTVQNATGIHPLDGAWDKTTLTSKTGATTANGQGVSWLVGQLKAGGREYVFASAVWKDGAGVDALEGTRLAARTFIERSLIKPRAR